MTICIKNKFTALIFIPLLVSSFASPIEVISQSSKSIYISGLFENKSSKGDSIRVIFAENYIYNLIGSKDFFVPINNNGAFNFQISPISHPGKMTLYLYGAEIARLNDYVIESGDSIYINIQKSNEFNIISFSGKGSEKYKCRSEIELSKYQFNILRDSIYNEYITSKNIISTIENTKKLFSLYNSGFMSMNNKLNQFKNQLTPDAYQYMKGEYLSYVSHTWLLQIRDLYESSKDQKQREEIVKIYQKNLLSVDADEEAGIALAQNYLNYLIDKTKMDLLITSEKGYTYQDLYQKLRNNYGGLLREKLLTSCLFDPKSKMGVIGGNLAEYDKCVEDAYALVQTPYLKDAIASLLSYKKGADAFNFNLPNASDKIVSLSDFKGKVVMLDFWATGCTGCAIFQNNFKTNISPRFIHNPKFVVISISLDADKKRWLTSVKSGRYTQEDHINLYTDGQGSKHPMLNNYDVQALPLILLIDKKGRIFSEFSIYTRNDEIVKIINEALEQE